MIDAPDRDFPEASAENDTPYSGGVATQLRDLLEKNPLPASEVVESNDDPELSEELEAVNEIGEAGAITTVSEYLATELDSRLELAYLARSYQIGASGGVDSKGTNWYKADFEQSEQEQSESLDSDERSARHRSVSARPDWKAHFPSDESREQLDQWDAFVGRYPVDMQVSLRGLLENKRQLDAAGLNPELMAEVRAEKANEHEIKQAAVLCLALKRKTEPLRHENSDLTWRAGRFEQPLSRAQLRHISENEAMIQHLEELRSLALAQLTSEQIDASTRHAASLELLHDRADLNRGLIETAGMRDIMDRHMASLLAGGNLLLVGETGGAKTALAKHIASNIQRLLGHVDPKTGKPNPPEFVSAYGEINAYQLIGKQELVKKDDATVTEFALGAISRAMVEGKPLIIDEINAMPDEVSKRLNELLQLKPGAVYTLQENGGQAITIKEGFCVIATANEKSSRYKAVNEMSAELKNRFASSTERVEYPDKDVRRGEVPPEHLRLAMAALADRHGNVPLERYGLTIDQFKDLLKAAHLTQRLFCEAAQTADAQYVADDRLRGNKTGLDKEVISPRLMTAMLGRVRDSGGQVKLDTLLTKFIDGIPHSSSDRVTIEKILKDHNLI